MTAERTSTKLYIPHPNQPELSICGVLEQYGPGIDTKGRKLALILHGTMGHKDYLFQRRLAQRFPIDSFRFDFRYVTLLTSPAPKLRIIILHCGRGNHETGGTWKQGALEEDLEDLNAVIAYLKSTYGYEIELVVGHSRGSLVGFRWISTTEVGRKVPAFVNVSGRYRMRVLTFCSSLFSQSVFLAVLDPPPTHSGHPRYFVDPDHPDYLPLSPLITQSGLFGRFNPVIAL
ncbi:hypothetical protein D9756_004961 [Leucocoprinus leucothites]|uniref:Uncharacterized protein n=1 Tax=Leucocoprinus leucothites TaxID=201217 RepID=A0A8H5G9L8_9AGAR|nr:hypothetical protein D9756_004961 [Leucoagaricus leucothites]